MAIPLSAAEQTGASGVRIVEWPREEFSERAIELMRIYASAMGYPPSSAGYRADTARRHLDYAGLQIRVAVDAEGAPVGFAYGYQTKPGQWWHDLVHRAMGPNLRDMWLSNAFELSEMHVAPALQGQGIGRALLRELCAGVTERTILLSTPDADTRAFRLYHSMGFIDLVRSYLFPGDSRPFAVLGSTLPLREGNPS